VWCHIDLPTYCVCTHPVGYFSKGYWVYYISLFTFTPFSPQLFVIQLVVSLVSLPQLLYGLRRGEGREPMRRTASWHTARWTRKPAAPMCRRKDNRGQLAGTRPATRSCQSMARQGNPSQPNPPLSRTTTGQLCVASWVSRSRPAVTQPGTEPEAVVTRSQGLRPLRHLGGKLKITFVLVYIMVCLLPILNSTVTICALPQNRLLMFTIEEQNWYHTSYMWIWWKKTTSNCWISFLATVVY
jgi:hypothetical protein